MYLGQLPKLSTTRRTISPFLFVSTRQFSLQTVITCTARGSPDGMMQGRCFPSAAAHMRADAKRSNQHCEAMLTYAKSNVGDVYTSTSVLFRG